jgi:hypothetical protein
MSNVNLGALKRSGSGSWRSAGILPARGTKACAKRWSAGILPARGTKTCANNVLERRHPAGSWNESMRQ